MSTDPNVRTYEDVRRNEPAHDASDTALDDYFWAKPSDISFATGTSAVGGHLLVAKSDGIWQVSNGQSHLETSAQHLVPYVESIIRYFDLQSEVRAAGTMRTQGGGKKIYAPVFPQYIALFLGIALEPFINAYMTTGTFALDLGAVWLRLLFSALIAVMLMPGIYKNAFDPQKPIFVQLAAIFTAGVGWQRMFEAASGV